MVKKLKAWLNIFFLTVILIAPGLVFATSSSIIKNEASPMDRLNQAAHNYGPYSQEATDTSFASILGLVINVALSLLGVIFMFIIILAGYQWMSAQGNEQNVSKAKESMTRAIMGLIVVISSYAVWTFIKINFIKQI